MKTTKKLLLILFMVALLFPGCMCSAEDRSRTTLESGGFSDIKLGGPAFTRCGAGDWYSNHFTAKKPRGTVVKGYICCGNCKGCTIRFAN